MKNSVLNSVLLVILFAMAFPACEEDGGPDCNREADRINISHTDSGLDLTLLITYLGSYDLEPEVVWDFGDGTIETITGIAAQHTYSQPGDYTVTATIIIVDNDTICEVEIEEAIDVE